MQAQLHHALRARRAAGLAAQGAPIGCLCDRCVPNTGFRILATGFVTSVFQCVWTADVHALSPQPERFEETRETISPFKRHTGLTEVWG